LFPFLTQTFVGRICTAYGDWLADNTPPDSEDHFGDWMPFCDRLQFETADFLFRQSRMSGGDIKQLLRLWKATLPEHLEPPFKSRDDLYEVIDNIPFGELGWESFTMNYPRDGQSSGSGRPSWMDGQYEVWHRNSLEVVESLISNPDFEGEFDHAPHQDYVNGIHCFQNLMSGNWAWRQAVSCEITQHNSHLIL
jgi:hypothetical protein